MNKTIMRILLLGLTMAAVFPRLHADTIGISVNGTCEAGSCPATPLPFNSTVTLPFDLTVTLPDGDSYLINGSVTATNNSNGGGFSASHVFQVTYEGNGVGGPSAADTISVEQFNQFQTTVSSVIFNRDVIGAFGATIAATSSISSCVNDVLGCVGPAKPPIVQSANQFFLEQ
jgi:hypothetical protein